MNYLLKYFIFLSMISVGLSELVDLDDKFIETYPTDQRSYLIMFYAPWCHHCKQLEPTYKELAQIIERVYNPNLIISRVDCTKYPSVATHFQIRGFPTVLFVHMNRRFEFVNDRKTVEFINFLKRVMPISSQLLENCKQINLLKREQQVFFLGLSNETIPDYATAAAKFQATDWFFHIHESCPGFDYNSVYCIKTSLTDKTTIMKYDPNSKVSMYDWIKLNRFPRFIKIGPSNLNYLMGLKKWMVLALSHEPIESEFLIKKDREYNEILEKISSNYPFHDEFVFGWTNQLEMINSFAIQTIDPIPNYIFINTTTMTFYLFENKTDINNKTENTVQTDKKLITRQLKQVLDSFVKKEPILEEQGGISQWNRFRRICFDGFVTLRQMFNTSPIVSFILFGFPITFFCIIIYCSCCSDLLKLDEEEIENEEETEDESGDKRVKAKRAKSNGIKEVEAGMRLAEEDDTDMEDYEDEEVEILQEGDYSSEDFDENIENEFYKLEEERKRNHLKSE